MNCGCGMCVRGRAEYAAKIRIKGPLYCGLWLCYKPMECGAGGLMSSGMSPENAYNNWMTFWGIDHDSK
jgi:hypothetical protein